MAVSDALGWGIWMPCLLKSAIHNAGLLQRLI